MHRHPAPGKEHEFKRSLVCIMVHSLAVMFHPGFTLVTFLLSSNTVMALHYPACVMHGQANKVKKACLPAISIADAESRL